MTTFECVASLVASELFGAAPAIGSKPDWAEVLECAHDQGVIAICYQAIRRLPAGLQPDFDTMLRWDVSAEDVIGGFEGRRQVKEHLRDLLASVGERVLLLKGETLADRYPHPEMRESGDIDIMPLDSYAHLNAFIESRGIEVDYSNSKHARFVFGGEEIENHDPVPHRDYNRNDYLTECLVAESLKDAVRRPDGCWELPPVAMAVHAVNHIALHLYMGEKVPLKMLADIAMLLKSNQHILSEWKPSLEKTGLTGFSMTVLRAIDAIFKTEWSDGGDSARFIRLYVIQDGRSRLARFFGKYRYIPRRPVEILRELWSKAVRVVRNRFRK